MKHNLKSVFYLAFAIYLPMTAIHAEEHEKMNHDMHNHKHSEMKTMSSNKTALVKGVINKIDGEGKQLNVTHEPVEALGWPKMTMDLPVTSKVDLETLKVGDKVEFMLKQGRDKKFRIIKIEPVK